MAKVGKPSGLTKRKGSHNWQFRMRCPKEFRHSGNPEGVWISLRTSVYQEALRRVDDARIEARARFAATVAREKNVGIQSSVMRLQRPKAANLPLLTLDHCRALARAFFIDALRDLDTKPLAAANLDDDTAYDLRCEMDDQIAMLEASADAFEDAPNPVDGAEASVLERSRLAAPLTSESSILLREYLRRAMLQIAQMERARFDGDYTDALTDSLFANLSSSEESVTESTRQHLTLRVAAQGYLTHLNRKRRDAKSQDRTRRTLDHIVAFLGPDTPIASVRRPDCDRLHDAFARLPANFQRQLAGGRSYEQIANARPDTTPPLAWNTVSTYLGTLTRFMDWAEEYEHIERSYAKRIEPLASKPDGSMAKLPFDAAELTRLFARPVYTGCVNDGVGFATAGPNIIRRARYWVPLIGLFGGLRAGEILQLTPSNFRVSPQGTRFIVLTKDMVLKNGNAEREIPVHPTLEAIGLIEWVERRRNWPTALLFPEVQPDRYGKASCTFSKRFASDLKYLELGERRKKLTFHSFRHTFKGALDRAGIGRDEKDELCGWSRGKEIGRRYGTGLKADVLKHCIGQVDFGIDLTHVQLHRSLLD